jgi:hypothetical protein
MYRKDVIGVQAIGHVLKATRNASQLRFQDGLTVV